MKIIVLDAATLGMGLDFSKLYDLGEVVIYENSAENEIAIFDSMDEYI